jgi:hypothetical protein
MQFIFKISTIDIKVVNGELLTAPEIHEYAVLVLEIQRERTFDMKIGGFLIHLADVKRIIFDFFCHCNPAQQQNQ